MGANTRIITMTEDSIQKQLIAWANHQPLNTEKPDQKKLDTEKPNKTRIGDYLHHSPNGGKRQFLEAKKFKAMGVKAGFPDLFLCIAKNGYHGLFIELKTQKGKPTALQQTWLNRLNGQGYKAVVCYGFDEAKEAIKGYLG